ncbi:putative zinc finger motif, C2HC5-type-domain-containing protein [Linnemannia elongata]|uniref:Zf-C2HC5-domain-containing protein n=1 Tax=Linnemannia elongata AG-77 TaxID=1314771 RepID=A0A197JQ60_9FUNG|nr:hypothetical protein BGZ88_006086 [Linnemannia elongata]KAH7051807.1 putative zinc finger motif, C2HC5-type-domain-containing protein [Linnemannia elongata]KAK5816155.1 putative zinc finger motif, C2HC5-type-domain-containing protein [Linnemannia elongata]OAQ26484.1 zf-C2HC5-domain-containing protein [Linnemannia elongata AG-77]
MSNRARKQAKKTAAEPLSELEKAIRAIDLATESVNATKERKPCYCLATKHKLNVFAPNCLNCGKIICALEGPGPCTYCGQQVVSIDQQQAMILELKREKAALAKLQQQATAKRRVKATAVSTAGYASKLGGGMSSATGAAGGWVGLDGSDAAPAMTEEEELEEAKKASLAQAHKEKLLEFDRTSAKRSHVIDQATDFVLPGDRPNLWLTEEERQAQADKARQNLEKVTSAASGYQRAKVMTIDVVNRRVVVEASANQFVQEEEDDAVPEPVSMFDQSKSTSISGGDRHGGRGGAFALNPLLRLGENPTFISKKTAKDAKDKVLKVKAEQKPKPKISKLQYDDGGHAAVMQDAEFSFSSGGDSQSVLASIVEPSCG